VTSQPYQRGGDERLHLLSQVNLFLFQLGGYLFQQQQYLDTFADGLLSFFMICNLLFFFSVFVAQVYYKLRHQTRKLVNAFRTCGTCDRCPASCICFDSCRRTIPNRSKSDVQMDMELMSAASTIQGATSSAPSSPMHRHPEFEPPPPPPPPPSSPPHRESDPPPPPAEEYQAD
jgi:hypothetical protein